MIGSCICRFTELLSAPGQDRHQNVLRVHDMVLTTFEAKEKTKNKKWQTFGERIHNLLGVCEKLLLLRKRFLSGKKRSMQTSRRMMKYLPVEILQMMETPTLTWLPGDIQRLASFCLGCLFLRQGYNVHMSCLYLLCGRTQAYVGISNCGRCCLGDRSGCVPMKRFREHIGDIFAKFNQQRTDKARKFKKAGKCDTTIILVMFDTNDVVEANGWIILHQWTTGNNKVWQRSPKIAERLAACTGPHNSARPTHTTNQWVVRQTQKMEVPGATRTILRPALTSNHLAQQGRSHLWLVLTEQMVRPPTTTSILQGLSTKPCMPFFYDYTNNYDFVFDRALLRITAGVRTTQAALVCGW